MHSRLEYQNRFAEFTGTTDARAFLQGRYALFILLKAVGVQEGDVVGVCGYTCLSVVEAVKRVGAIPAYLDVDEYLCISPDILKNFACDSLKVIILQHTFGNPGQFDKIVEISKNKGWIIIEDCAHAIGCKWNGRLLGSFGVGAIYSFQWGKPYTTGMGGMLTVNSKSLLQKVDDWIEKLAYPMSNKQDIILSVERFLFHLVGQQKIFIVLRNIYRNFRDKGVIKGTLTLDSDFGYYSGYVRIAGELMSKAGINILKKWTVIEKIRRENVKRIEQALKAVDMSVWPLRTEADIVMLRYPVEVSDKAVVLAKAKIAKLDIAGWYLTPIHPVAELDYDKIGYKTGLCINSEQMINRVVHLPTGKGLTQDSLIAIIDILKKHRPATN